MCGRFTLTVDDFDALLALTGAVASDEELREHYRQRYNQAPMQRGWIVRPERESRVLDRARWGLVNFWAKDNSRASRQINARGETVHERPAYRNAFKERRCLVPASRPNLPARYCQRPEPRTRIVRSVPQPNRQGELRRVALAAAPPPRLHRARPRAGGG